jgi:hypothetical protein
MKHDINASLYLGLKRTLINIRRLDAYSREFVTRGLGCLHRMKIGSQDVQLSCTGKFMFVIYRSEYT